MYKIKTVFRYKASFDLFGKVHQGMIKILRSNNLHAQISRLRGPQLSSFYFVPFRNKNSRAFISRRTGCEWCLLLRRDGEIPHAHPISE